MRTCIVCNQLLRNRKTWCSRTCRIYAPVVRFWSKVDKSGECWVWMGVTMGRGYGVFYTNKKQYPAHRYAWELENGPIPEGLEACHICDNPACVRPSHIFIGTHKENIQDAVRKKRHGIMQHPEKSVLRNKDIRFCGMGEQNASAKLTDVKVRSIRQMYADKIKVTVIASLMGVAISTVRSVIRRDSWEHVL